MKSSSFFISITPGIVCHTIKSHIFEHATRRDSCIEQKKNNPRFKNIDVEFIDIDKKKTHVKRQKNQFLIFFKKDF